MINTYYGLDALGEGGAFFSALVIGFFFGLALERAGFGSSRRIAGIFYFRDMAVLKVMFTALVVAMLGLAFAASAGIIDVSHQIHYIKSYYGTYMVAGLIFGIGFVISGWCPGTAAVGLASGKVDALVFLAGAIIGSVLFNELFPVIKPLYTWGESVQTDLGEPGLAFVYESLGITKNTFLISFTILAILCFWGSEYIEKMNKSGQGGVYFNSPFLKAFCLVLVIFAAALPLLSQRVGDKATVAPTVSKPASYGVGVAEDTSLEGISSRKEHMAPEELASLLLKGKSDLVVVDLRPEEAYDRFHIRGAVNVKPQDLQAFMHENRGRDEVVLYSNGMIHSTRARDALVHEGYGNVLILTDGLRGFLKRCLKPVSLRPEPVDIQTADRIRAWRDYFIPHTLTGHTQEPS